MNGQQMSQSDLASHSQALYSLLMKPVVKSTPAWNEAFINIQMLANCMDSYKTYLHEQLETQTENQKQLHPCKPISENATVEHRKKVDFIAQRYSRIDQVMRDADEMSPVFFDETLHLKDQFEDSKQRSRFFENLFLTVPVFIIRYCPGGSRVTTSCLIKYADNKPPEAKILIDGARLLNKIQSRLNEVHTRAQKKAFKEKIDLITTMTPAVRSIIYSHLTTDGSASCNPEMQERLRLISLGNTEIVDDLRHLNTGRPKAFEPFFDKLEEVIEEVTAADDRRHNTAHLSQWFSVEELIECTKARLPEDTPVPSGSLVRLQFAPKNPFTHRALCFTGRFDVQYKVQRRQLRVSHQDQHYCAAILKYFKHMAVEQKDAKPVVLFCDDKAKIPVGEPEAPVSTGVRGKKTLAPTETTLIALDHDMTKASITPSVYLSCHVPDTVDKSFVRGVVTTVTNDSVFETSGPFRHAATICKMLKNEQPKIVMKYTDGGTDQRNNLESVKCANICVFKELNLDMLVHARCAPGHSWTNPAERVMSVLNIALQNCSLEREKLADEHEKEFQKCNSMAQLREVAAKKPEVKVKWRESIEPVQSTIRNRFLRLKLKDHPFQALDPMTETDIDVVKRHLRELFPTLDTDKLQKVHTSKVPEYADWMSRHSRQSHYIFQLKKCQDADCCIPGENIDTPWLPDPMLDETGEHYYPYDVAKTMETSEACRPSLKQTKTLIKQTKKTKSSAGKSQTTHDNPYGDELQVEEPTQHETPNDGNVQDTSLYTTQNARALVTCVECRKPRVIYCKQRLTERSRLSLAITLSELDFVCGSPITKPSSKLTVSCRPCECATPVEIPYYGSALGQTDVCAFCGSSGGEVDQDLKLNFKTVLPLCSPCKLNGLKPIVFRPYGKNK
ncbi:uncharacterized protein LOC127882125 isoform X2 [Dreissena polymorpha]|nr:uncharacterized protein LOC127882125 isoform X2 [Dreissena polymorpha]